MVPLRALIPMLALAACERAPTEPVGACDPLVPEVCALPFPSDHFLRADPTTPSGVRLALAPDALPVDLDGAQVPPDRFNVLDGFSTLAGAIAWLPGATDTGLPGPFDPGLGLDLSAPTALVDLETGARVPHWVDLDRWPDNPDERVLIVQPATPLRPGARYAVGLSQVVDAAGAPIPPAEGFRALRDGERVDDPGLSWRQADFDETVFPALEAAGLPRAELQLAWTFTTGTDAHRRADLVAMREGLLAELPEAGPSYRIAEIEELDCAAEGAHIARRVHAEITVPSWLERDEPGASLARDAEGAPMRVEAVQVPVQIQVPCSLGSAPGAGLLVQYGHGLFQDRGEVTRDWLEELADRERLVVFSTDWKGLSRSDVGETSLLLVERPGDFPVIPERLHQAWIDAAAALRAMRGALGQDPALQVAGVPVVDPEQFAFYGVSQGAVLGGGYLGFSPDHHRGALGVPGTPFQLLLPRSTNFTPFYRVLATKHGDGRNVALLVTLFQQRWDAGETAGWVSELAARGTPVLIQTGTHDAQVSPIGARVLARALGAGSLVGAQAGLAAVSGPQSGSTFVEWDYTDTPEVGPENVPPDGDFDTHQCVRREPLMQEQLVGFLRTGVVEDVCAGGACAGTSAHCVGR